tara:strand:- start:612 stop:1052 length:441 start_codon:yes stop_codon:yes gene_type:complete
MLSTIIFALTYYSQDLMEDSIQNSCIFKIIRFNKKDIMCSDYGLNKKYCNNYYLPYQFSVEKEFGLNHKVNYNIEPKAIFEDYSNQKTILANIYYTFTCSYEDNEPRLLLNIVPIKDDSFLEEFVTLSYMISFALTLCIFIKCLLR